MCNKWAKQWPTGCEQRECEQRPFGFQHMFNGKAKGNLLINRGKKAAGHKSERYREYVTMYKWQETAKNTAEKGSTSLLKW